RSTCSGSGVSCAGSGCTPGKARQANSAGAWKGFIDRSWAGVTSMQDRAPRRKFSAGGFEQPGLAIAIARHAVDESRRHPEGMRFESIAEDVRHGPAMQGQVVG